jgi:YrhK-like protein
MAEYPRAPEGWVVASRRASGPFATEVTFAHPDGRTVRWSSRRHRKHTSRLSRTRPGREQVLWAPHRASWWIAVLFVVGSTCFLLGPLPFFLDAVGPQADAWVFFVGSVFFTCAATLQWLETVNADPGPVTTSRGPLRLVAWEPRRIDWWSSGVQLVGTVFFNATTWRALSTAVGATSYDQAVWRPDAYGSICFLVSGYLAHVEVSGGWLHGAPRSLEGVLVAVNLFGCVAFAVSAVASYVPPSTSDFVAVNVANAATSIGALAFLVGAVLLLPEGARSPS